jgi:hypothetical protein
MYSTKLRFLVVFILLFEVKTSTGQIPFSVIYGNDSTNSIDRILFEDLGNIYTMNYRNYITNSTAFEIKKIDKKNGEIIHNSPFNLPHRWHLFGNTNITKIGNNLIFGKCADSTLFKLNYNMVDNKVTVLDTINHNGLGTYIHDLILHGDTTVYFAGLYAPDQTYPSVIYKYPAGKTKIISLDTISNFERTGGKVDFLFNGNFLIFGAKISTISDQISVIEMDSCGSVVSEVLSPKNDIAFGVKEVIPLENQQYIIMAEASRFPTSVKNYFYHIIYMYDHKTKKILWTYKNPILASQQYSGGGRIIKGHNEKEFLYCSMVNALGFTTDSFFTKGKVVKLKDNGEKVWEKVYYYSSNHNDGNEFHDLMATSDGHYMIGGNIAPNRFIPWLVKIDEDGNIVPIDTTSATTTPITSIPEITIYPNPAHDHIIINQGEQTDMTYTIYNMQGRAVLMQKISGSHQNTVWDISQLDPGAYVLSISQQGKPMVSRALIKE